MEKLLIILLALTVLVPSWGVATSGQVLENSLTVIIKKGDTVCKIAGQYMKNPQQWREMLKSEGNRHIKNPNKVYLGQSITIPGHMLKEEYVKKYVKNEEKETEIEKLKAEIGDLRATIEEKNQHIAKLEKELADKCVYIKEQELKITRFEQEVSTLTMSLNNKDTILEEKEKELKMAKKEVEKLVEKRAKLEEEYQEAQKAVKADKMLANAIIAIERANEKGALRYEKKLIKSAELLKEKAVWAQLCREYDKSIILAEESVRDASEAEHIATNMVGKYKLSFLFDHFYFWNLRNKSTLLQVK